MRRFVHAASLVQATGFGSRNEELVRCEVASVRRSLATEHCKIHGLDLFERGVNLSGLSLQQPLI